MKKLLLVFFVALFCSATAYSQELAPQLDSIALPIALKVKDVVSVVPISATKQVALADFFQRETAALTAALNSAATPVQLDVLRNQYKTEFQNILSPAELLQYSNQKKGSVYAKTYPTTTAP